MSNYKISIIIVFNDEAKLNEAKKYIFQQTLDDIELIALDNRHQHFSSAAQALNFGASIAQSDILIFMHQDVYLWDLNFCKKYYDYLSNLPEKENVIAGVVGARETDGGIVGDFYEGKIAKVRPLRLTNGEITKVYSVDEFLFAMKKSVWKKLKFDEKNCFDWHFYAVDICYANRIGGVIMVTFFRNMSRFQRKCRYACLPSDSADFNKKYRGKVKRIDGSCFRCECSYLGYFRWRIWKIRCKLIGW